MKQIKKKLLLMFVATFFLFHFSFSQNITIIGYTTDSTYTPITGVIIKIEKDNTPLATSDTKGKFTFSIKKEAIKFTFSHINYETQSQQISSYRLSQTKNDTVLLVVMLREKSTTIDSIQIFSSDNKRAEFIKKSNKIIDFEMNDNFICLLEKMNHSKRKLSFYDFQNKLIDSIEFESSATKLYKDCLGNIHLCEKDNKYQQIHYENKNITFSNISTEDFNRWLLPCVAVVENTAIYMEKLEHNKKINYYHSSNKIWELLYCAYDKKAAQSAQSYYNEIIAYYFMATSPEYKRMLREMPIEKSRPEVVDENIIKMGIWDGNVSKLIVDNESQRLVGFYKGVVSRPVFAPLVSVKDSIYIFDFVNNSTVIFSKDFSEKRNYKLELNQQKNWKYEIITDIEKENIYEINYEPPIKISQIMGENKSLILNIGDAEKVRIYKNKIYILSQYNSERKVQIFNF